MTALLVARSLSKEYRNRASSTGSTTPFRAVDRVDLEIGSGETLALVGESGSGKTTLARMLARLLEPTSGEIRFAGVDLLALRGRELRAARRRLQSIFQDPLAALDPRMRIGDSVAEPLEIHRLARGRAIGDRVAALLAEVGLDSELAERMPHELSGGQLQRIGIARALATDPELLIADEPVSALDPSVQAQIVHLLAERRRARRLAVLFVAHDLALVERISERIVVLFRGRVVESGATVPTLRSPRHPYTAMLRAATPGGGYRPMTAEGPPEPAESPSPGGCAFAFRCPIARERCRFEAPELRHSASAGAVACHYPGEALPGAGENSGIWNFSSQAT
ncbi:MAG: oligopeptide/dipeptide ABC transporter ATP-binding protein [Thermoanaerobaculia bacterium]